MLRSCRRRSTAAKSFDARRSAATCRNTHWRTCSSDTNRCRGVIRIDWMTRGFVHPRADHFLIDHPIAGLLQGLHRVTLRRRATGRDGQGGEQRENRGESGERHRHQIVLEKARNPRAPLPCPVGQGEEHRTEFTGSAKTTCCRAHWVPGAGSGLARLHFHQFDLEDQCRVGPDVRRSADSRRTPNRKG